MSGYKRIGISGGTFDPIHYGHLITAEQVREKFSLDKVLFIPSGNPPHKDSQVVTGANHRFNMVCSAIEGNPYFEVSRVEIDRPGKTYTVDTLEQLKNLMGSQSTLFFIIGADVVADLLTWKEPRKVFGLCEFIAVFRPGYHKEDFYKQIDFLKLEYGAKINITEVPMIEISSTQIRERVKNGLSIRYMTHYGVERYINEHRLYLNDN